ncbi:phage portal protein, partial [Apilactobacillus xinyiensis]|uniref:phage portal protein n=1 Tax=Apilactobacillus xinyiensis TaxID=2841032 RepID=UPI00200E6BCE|nr:phage portal protein [Apilactobacillus xinyiensis]
MDITQMRKVLNDTDGSRQRVIEQNNTSLRYYLNENDITLRNNGISKINKKGKKEALRSADNRISNNFHELIVDQEASYLTSNRPQFDVNNDDELNKQVDEVLGDDLTLMLNKLVVDASNAGAGWVHYWVNKGNFNYAIVPPEQITPIYDESLVNGLIAVRRTYTQRDADGILYDIHEYWDDEKCTFFKCKSSNATYKTLEIYNKINYIDNTTNETTDNSNVYKHGLGRIPFIKFAKNLHEQPELSKYKGLIDAYDSIYNGYLNDLDDIQEVVFVLKNFGGEDLASFKKDLKEN